MILRLSDSLSRALVVIASFLVAVWLSFFGVRTAIARYGSEGDDAKRLELAVRLESGSPVYWYTLGRYYQYNLEQPNSVLAEESFRKAITLNPLYTNAWLDLGTGYELEGKREEARQAFLRAKKSYPTSADVSWQYGNFLLREGDRGEAYKQLRRAIEADPQRAAMAFSRAYRANPNIDEILGQLLPISQKVYTEVISEALSEKQLAVAKIVWAQLLSLQPHLTIREIDELVRGLLQAGEFSQARQVWDQGVATMTLPPLFQAQGSVIWDPGFESDIKGYSFSWEIPSTLVQGVSFHLDKTEKHSGNQSLRLSFDGKHNPNLEAVCTLGIVQPDTTYHFSGWIKTKDITTEYGVGLRIKPVNDNAGVKTPELRGTNPWTLVDQTWTAGPNIHRVQVCVVREPSDNPAMRISGNAWVDDVNLVPLLTEPQKP